MMHNSRCLSILSVCLWVPLSLCTLVPVSSGQDFQFDTVTYNGLCNAWYANLSAAYADFPESAITLDEIMWWCYETKGLTSPSDYFVSGPGMIYLVSSSSVTWASHYEVPRIINWKDSLIVDTNSMLAPGCYTGFRFCSVVSSGPFDTVAEIEVSNLDYVSLPRWLDLLHQCPQINRSWSFPVSIPVYNVSTNVNFSCQSWQSFLPPLSDPFFSWAVNLAPAGYMVVYDGLLFRPYPGYQGGESLPLGITDPLQAMYTASTLQDCPFSSDFLLGAAFIWPSDSDFEPIFRSHVNYDVTIRKKPE